MNFERFILEKEIALYLLVLKISPSLKGYTYIMSGTCKIAQDMSKKHNVTNRLYNEISEEFKVNKNLIDRAMRHAIDVSIKRNGIADFERFSSFDFSSDKPTPRELLAILAEKAVIDKYSFTNQFYKECEKYPDEDDDPLPNNMWWNFIIISSENNKKT